MPQSKPPPNRSGRGAPRAACHAALAEPDSRARAKATQRVTPLPAWSWPPAARQLSCASWGPLLPALWMLAGWAGGAPCSRRPLPLLWLCRPEEMVAPRSPRSAMRRSAMRRSGVTCGRAARTISVARCRVRWLAGALCARLATSTCPHRKGGAAGEARAQRVRARIPVGGGARGGAAISVACVWQCAAQRLLHTAQVLGRTRARRVRALRTLGLVAAARGRCSARGQGAGR